MFWRELLKINLIVVVVAVVFAFVYEGRIEAIQDGVSSTTTHPSEMTPVIAALIASGLTGLVSLIIVYLQNRGIEKREAVKYKREKLEHLASALANLTTSINPMFTNIPTYINSGRPSTTVAEELCKMLADNGHNNKLAQVNALILISVPESLRMGFISSIHELVDIVHISPNQKGVLDICCTNEEIEVRLNNFIEACNKIYRWILEELQK